eukprot:COSAG04_NODE_1998_length_5038_cov_2.280624_4_plen_292_part_00
MGVLAAALAAAVPIVGSCADDEDCSLNGRCQAQRCLCDPPWSGADCGRLTPRPAPRIGGYGVSPNVTTWGGSVVEYQGEYHMYATEEIVTCGMGCYSRNSRVIHGVASTAEGPYARADAALPVFATSPEVVLDDRDPAKPLFALFHVGNGTHTAPPEHCHDGTPRECSPGPGWGPGEGEGRLHLASSPAGPWTAAPTQPPTCNNPAPMLHPNGSWFLLCGSHTFEIYRAATLAGPCERHPARPLTSGCSDHGLARVRAQGCWHRPSPPSPVLPARTSAANPVRWRRADANA